MKILFRTICAIALLAITGCSEVRLYSNLPEQEVNEMIAILRTSSISCSKVEGEEGTWNVTVAENSYADAVAILSESGRPRKKRPTMEDLFPKTGFTSSPAEQRIRMTYGLEQSLESTIEALPGGVIDARVHLVLPDNQPLRESAKPSRANVVVVHKKGADIQDALTTIQQIVIGGVDGLDVEGVSVEMVEAEDNILAERVKAADKGPQLSDIAGIKVAKESVSMLIGVLSVGALGICAALALLFLRMRNPRRGKASANARVAKA